MSALRGYGTLICANSHLFRCAFSLFFFNRFQFCFVEPSKFSQTLNGIPSSNTVSGGMDPFHACSILQQLKTMYDEGQLTDIVVEVDHGKTFSCHRNVLAAISPYFRYKSPLFSGWPNVES